MYKTIKKLQQPNIGKEKGNFFNGFGYSQKICGMTYSDFEEDAHLYGLKDVVNLFVWLLFKINDFLQWFL